MNIVRWICDIGVGVISGILLTGSIVYEILEELGSISIGFMTGHPDYPWITKVSLVIGVVHGFVVALAVILSFRTNTIIGNILAGWVATEIGIALAQTYIFLFLLPSWRLSTTTFNSIMAALVYFLVLSGIILIPTILLGLIVAKIDRFMAAR